MSDFAPTVVYGLSVILNELRSLSDVTMLVLSARKRIDSDSVSGTALTLMKLEHDTARTTKGTGRLS